MRPGANAGEWVNYNDFIINTPGTYWIRVSVYTESGETIKSDAYYITVKAAADKTKPLIDPIKLSATKVTEYSELEISTAASDNVGLKSIQLFINDEKVKEWSAKGTYTTISHTVSGYSVGSHTVKVIAIDQSGNQNSVETTFTVEKKQGGEIYSVEMSSYNFKAGTTITFTVTTSADTEKIRLRNGNWVFPNDITDSTTKNGKKVWVFEQYVETPGVNRILTVETYLNGWTGKTMSVTFTVTPAEKNIPSFDIDLAIFGFNGGSASWTVPVNVTPDRYVINIGGPNTYSAETTTNSITFGSSVFTLPGTYTISVTAQKDGYNPYTTSMTITLNCDHSNLKPISSRDTNEMYFDETYHMVNTEITYECQTCGGQITKTEQSQKIEHTHNVQLEQNGWVCSCGYANTGDYKSWTGYLQSDENQPVYANPKNFKNANVTGTIFVDSVITVLGECENAYYVSYVVTVGTGNQRAYSNSKTKTGYVPKEKIDSVKYDKGSVYDIYVDGKSVLSNLHDNNTLYSDLIALMNKVGGNVKENNGKYDISVTILHPVNLNKVTFTIKYSSTTTHSWSNVKVQLMDGTAVTKELLIGSYIYLDRVFIETDKLMEFLGYSIDGLFYTSPNSVVDYKLYYTAQNVVYAGDAFYEQYDAMAPEAIGKIESFLAHLITLDWGDMVSQIDYDNYKDIVNAVESMLVRGNYTEEQKGFDDILLSVIEEFISANLNVIEISTNEATTKSVTELMHITINNADEMNSFFGHLGNFVDVALSAYNVYEITYSDALILKAMAINLDDNLKILKTLKANTESDEMRQIYTIIEERLMGTYVESLSNILDPNEREDDVAEEMLNMIVGISVGTVATIVGGTAGSVIAIGVVAVKVLDTVFCIEDKYEAHDAIYSAFHSIELVTRDVESAMDKYLNLNTPDKYADLLANNAIILASLKINALNNCLEYLKIEDRNIFIMNMLTFFNGGFINILLDDSNSREELMEKFNADIDDITEYKATLEEYIDEK